MPIRTHDGIKKRCDCAKRNWPKCDHAWHFSFHHGDREYRLSLDAIARARGVPLPRSKGDAVTWRDDLRRDIKAGTFIDPTLPVVAPAIVAPTVDSRLTVGDVVDAYVKRHVRTPTRKDAARDAMEWVLDLIRATPIPAADGTSIRLEQKPFDAVNKADIEAFRDARRAILAQAKDVLAQALDVDARAARTTEKAERRALRDQARALRRSAKCRPGAKGGTVGVNRHLARLRHVFSWAIEEGYVADTPFKRGAKTVVHMETRAETARTRRLAPGEEDRLLAHAGPHLRALIVAALATGCRLGELLGLQWQQIDRDAQGVPAWIRLSASQTKTNESRDIPIGMRLRAELDMRKHGPDGKDHAPDAFVFGNDCGEAVASIKTAWRATCRRAGISNLHYHDLRREFGSRLLESGADQHDVQACLGHANIKTTSRYLKSKPDRLKRALDNMEAGIIRTPFAQTADSAQNADASSPASDVPKLLIQ